MKDDLAEDDAVGVGEAGSSAEKVYIVGLDVDICASRTLLRISSVLALCLHQRSLHVRRGCGEGRSIRV